MALWVYVIYGVFPYVSCGLRARIIYGFWVTYGKTWYTSPRIVLVVLGWLMMRFCIVLLGFLQTFHAIWMQWFQHMPTLCHSKFMIGYCCNVYFMWTTKLMWHVLSLWLNSILSSKWIISCNNGFIPFLLTNDVNLFLVRSDIWHILLAIGNVQLHFKPKLVLIRLVRKVVCTEPMAHPNIFQHI